jgi:hypothetical protein
LSFLEQDVLCIAAVKFDITPEYPVSLLGYFNERLSTGVLDPLFCRIAALEGADKRLLFIQIDSCLIPTEDAEWLRDRISQTTAYKKEEILICTSHTHTAPALTDFFEAKRETDYCKKLQSIIIEKTTTLCPEQACTVKVAKSTAEGLSSNRRWIMSDGKVQTNPPKRSTHRVRPEGPSDPEILIVGFYTPDGLPAAFFVNISNHTDTVGGNDISADWPGAMERYLDECLGYETPIFVFIAPQGNINHFDFNSSRNQTSYKETLRIGKAYARKVSQALSSIEEMNNFPLSANMHYLDIPPREVHPDELSHAKAEIQKGTGRGGWVQLTSRELAKGNPRVKQLFAEEMLRFYRNRPPVYRVPLQVVSIGSISFCAIPGEPFVEIGLRLKSMGGSNPIIPVALSNGYFGYIPLEECFSRGGYEVLSGPHNCLSKRAEKIILSEFMSMLQLVSQQQN